MWVRRWALAQLDSGTDLEKNLEICGKLIRRAAAAGCTTLAFPEFFLMRAAPDTVVETSRVRFKEAIDRLCRQAKKFALNILAGSLPLAGKNGDMTIYNTALFIGASGEVLGSYRKIHLFSAVLKDHPELDEPRYFGSGEKSLVQKFDGVNCGIGICYDLRFPELFRQLADRAAELVFLPASFTRYTGAAHWKPLLRARAIENQCYLVAPAQTGKNRETGLESYGHSLVVDPWGRVVAEAGCQPQLLIFRLSQKKIEQARGRINALKDRRLGRG